MQEIYYTHQVKKEIDRDKRLPKEIYQAIVNRLIPIAINNAVE